MKKSILSLGLILFAISPILAQQNLGLEQGAESLWDEVKGAAVYILAAVFLVSAIANSGKLTGENRDYMGFFRGILLWFAAITIIGGVITYILSLKF
ncbi:hypothetical protein [Maribacter sp. 4G9]|jgi:hypothetical protein|uniref:hypothetical protein n=1 Tax=Maribacter sp. 4G9 TaxID=1889777 RepID=UPI000C1529B0|nr:hypothetical protein [Maribacter sp. 4G9]PIB39062.1 hypothetical protein BFP75_00880 [Maribacter sp. 4G9]